MQAKHTPTPWESREEPDEDNICIGIKTTMGFCPIANVPVYFEDTDNEYQFADAAFIVRACNAHEKLLNALDNLLAQTFDKQMKEGFCLTESETTLRAKALDAIALAIGENPLE